MSQTTTLRWRLGAVVLLLAALVASPFLWQAASQAGGPKFAPQVLAAFKDKTLNLSVRLTGPAEKGLSGKVSVELLDAAGRSLGSSDSKLVKFDPSVDMAFH